MQRSPKSIYLWNNAIKAVYLWGTKIRPTDEYPKESIAYKMNADSSWNLYVPLAWYKQSSQAAPYDWNVSVDWWTATHYSWTWWSGRSITISGYTAWSNHTIMITPTTVAYQWACAYWWYNTAWRTYLTDVLYDWSYIWFGLNATDTWTYFRYSQYQWCTNLQNPPEEYIPSNILTIGNNFRQNQYYWCSKLLYAPEEALPRWATKIWTQFRSQQYQGCSLLAEIKGWKDLKIGSSQYRADQFNWAWQTNSLVVRVLTDVWYAAYGSWTLVNNNVATVYVPSAYLSNFTWSWSYPRSSITDSKFVWY